MKNKSITVNYIMNIVLTMSSFAFSLITFPYATRILQPAGMGKVSFAASLISYFSIFAQFGIPIYGIRECAKIRDDRNELSQTALELFIVNIISSISVSALFIISIFIVPRLQQEKPLYIIMGISLLLNAIGMEWLYKALEEYTYIAIRSIAFKLIACVLLFSVVATESDYVIYGFLTIFAASASNIWNAVNVRKYIHLKFQRKPQLVRHCRSALVFAAMSFSTTIYINLDIVMLGFIKSDSEVGCYDAAVKIKKVLVSAITALGGVLLPRAAFLLKNDKTDSFFRMNSKAVKYVITASVPLMVYFTIFARECIFLLCGSSYERAVFPMQIIMPTVLFIGMSNVTGIQTLVASGKEKTVLLSEIGGAVIDLILNALLIPKHGAAGAAVGTTVAEILVLAIQCFALKDAVGVLFVNMELKKVLTATGLALLPTWLMKFILSGFVLLGCSFALYFILYIAILMAEKDEMAILLRKELKRICPRINWRIK
ncbi:MAG: flippase [Lachnospiraceae bacterium]|nr:flippase [Lachnospiraceae bacterium]